MEQRLHTKIAGILTDRRGRTQVEVLAVLVLLLLMGISTFTLAMAGTDSYKAINAFRDDASAVRIATAYTQMRVHRHDNEGALALAAHPVTGKQALVIRETEGGVGYETWIYYNDGALREALVKQGQSPTDEFSFEIVRLDSYRVIPDSDARGLTVEAAEKDSEGRLITLKTHVAFRSGGVRP